jgi:hypothetical protein
MFRKDLIDLLLGNPMGVSQIARAVTESPSQIADDLQHLLRSLKHSDYCSSRDKRGARFRTPLDVLTP